MEIFLFLAAHWYLSLFTQTFFHHRYAAHEMFTMSRTWEKVFFFLSLVFQGSSYLSPKGYGIMHRQHHAFADTEKDPHSPKYSKNLFDMMWKTKNNYTDIIYEKVDIDPAFTKNLPVWDNFDKVADNWAVRLAWAGFYIGFYLIFATQWWMYLFLPVHFVMGPFHGAIINWFAHKIGYRNFKVADTSSNIMPVDILMLGEGYHNNHHARPYSANFGARWYEFDPIYPIIKTFHKLRIIRLKETKRVKKLQKAA